MKKYIILFIVYVSILSAGVSTYVLLFSKDYVDEQKGEHLLEKVKASPSHDHTSKNESEHNFEPNEDLVQAFQNEKNIVAFLLVTLKQKDEQLFKETFMPEQYMNDLFKVSDTPHEDNVTKQFMRDISRNGTLEKIEVIKHKSKRFKESGTIKTRFIFEDKQRVNVLLRMKLLGTQHEIDDEIYYITTSVLDIVHQIDSQIK
ncbi:hypothetical protein GLW08_20530 [Pontibacillus yanchengensis]|uniref:Uncharacterized protein n=2 Tax=Pontibacillus yanchengensis TaxID=462910 RepID=A0ACC7VLJ3_9BACI|nr:hypothetical protein [Pontibacillus yanchengensis]MYL35492.1 hypothetical protein [Pontibacillus yanchengensis]MYL55692.1 hypothetical protein [Pontibacillus yanchengensis]